MTRALAARQPALVPERSAANDAREPEGVGWRLGTNQAYLRELIAYWRDEFDWRAAERRLNEF